jgi:hypothetical protein
MRTQYCRDHIGQVAESCGIGASLVREVTLATDFVDEHADFCNCSTDAILTLMRIPDEDVKDLTISHIKTVLKEEMPRGGKKYPYVTENQIKAFRARFELQVSNARQKEATRLRKEAEKKYAEIKEIADAEEKKRENAESLGVVLKVKDPITEAKRSEAKKELDRLNAILEEQSTRRKEQERILKDVEAKYATRLERVGACKAGLKKAEDEVRETLGYRNSIMKEIRIIDDNSRITSGKIAEQAKLLV